MKVLPRRGVRGRARWLLAVPMLLVACGFSVPSCVVREQPPDGATGPNLQFVGDSITAFASPVIQARFAARFRVSIEAVAGITTLGQSVPIAVQALSPPDVEIINLGTNDAHCAVVECPHALKRDFTVGLVTARLDHFAQEFPASTCVVFTTLNTHNPSWNPKGAAQVNEHLRATYLHVADWDAAWSSTYFSRPDDPHPNARGQQALATVLAQAVAGCPPPTPRRPHVRAF